MTRLVGIEHYDVVILSYSTPGTPGAGLVRFIRALEHRRTTAIVIVSSSGEVRDEALAAGADEVLPKPSNALALVSAVDRHAPRKIDRDRKP
jgi:DNA-binding response OmpR family regulator